MTDIRPLVTEDVQTLVRLARQIWHNHYPGIISPAQIDYMLAQRYTTQSICPSLASTHWLTAWKNGTMAGFAQGFACDHKTWQLDKLYVHPDCQHRGIGRALFSRIHGLAENNGAERLVLRVNRNNALALKAYTRFGFRIYAENVLEIGNGYVMDDYLMELALGAGVDCKI